MKLDKSQAVKILYTSPDNETDIKVVYPERIIFDKTDALPRKQWVLEAFDPEDDKTQLFSMNDIEAWVEVK